MDASEAARALDEVAARRAKVVDANLAPNWFWPALGGLIAVFVAAVDSRRPALVTAGAVVFAVGLAAVLVTIARRARPALRNDAIGPRGVGAILAVALGIVAAAVAVQYGLLAAGFGYARTGGAVVAAVLLTIAGPPLNRYLRRVALEQR